VVVGGWGSGEGAEGGGGACEGGGGLVRVAVGLFVPLGFGG